MTVTRRSTLFAVLSSAVLAACMAPAIPLQPGEAFAEVQLLFES